MAIDAATVNRPMNTNFDAFVFTFRSEFESDYGCRGAISLDKATIKVIIFENLLGDNVAMPRCI